MDKLDPLLSRLNSLLSGLASRVSPARRPAVERWRSDADALRFHLQPPARGTPLLLAVVGGTGTGKSTLVNRLLGQDVSATSFRRTFTAGAVAVAASSQAVPAGWLGVEHLDATTADLPARGRIGALVVVCVPGDLTARLTLIDTPDLDGDQPEHHAEADRVFRWAQAVAFLVTPEKYQMTELLPYYRLAARYEAPAVFVMNKCEEEAVLQDYRKMLEEAFPPAAGGKAERVFAVARDSAGYEPPSEQNLSALRASLLALPENRSTQTGEGLRRRAGDLLGQFVDQVLSPLREDRREADRLSVALRGLETPAVGVDVNPITQQLQRRLQQRSILYLMGPQRILDRVRQAPGLLARLPRVAWDYMVSGEIDASKLQPAKDARAQAVPDFHAILSDQFAVLHSRIDDQIRSSRTGQTWLAGESARAARIDAAEAGKIADEELADLRAWLEKRWNATPRDTKAIQALLRYLPGGKKLVAWTEAAPYLLTLIVVTHHAFFGHVDLLVIGGYGLATWLTERISNEVARRTRAANQRISDRFAALAHEQIEKTCAWLDHQAPPLRSLEQLDETVRQMEEVIQP